LNREDQRLAAVVFVSERPARRAKAAQVEQPAELTGARKTLEEAERHYRDRDFDQAKTAYLRVLKETGEQPLHAKAYYGLARIAANQRDPQLAEDLFEKTLTSSPDAEVQAWSHVYLGRLADAAGEREQATGITRPRWMFREDRTPRAPPPSRACVKHSTARHSSNPK